MTSLQRSRVLLVDDNQQNRYVISRILERANLTVEQGSTGREALERIQSQPDLVILDVKLPDVSGYEVCRQIKNDPATAAIPVLQISASFVNSESRVQALEGGADGYLTHPIEPAVLVATVRSLLRLKRAEAAARESAEEWKSTFDALSEALVLLDPQNSVIRFNDAFAELAGERADIAGTDGAALLDQIVGRSDFLAMAHAGRHSVEACHNSVWFEVTVDAVMSEGRRIGSIVVVTDITARKLAAQSLQNAEKLAATGRLAQTIAHEINNPLEALTNLIFLAQHSTTEPEVPDYLRQAMAELERVARITKQILSFHRETKSPIPVNAHELLDSVVSLYKSQLAARQIQFEWNTKTVPAICGYPGELRQAFANLLGNALDASSEGGKIVIRARAGYNGKQHGVAITIHDNGVGIPASIRSRIMEPFFTTKELKGTGLGLWLTRNIVSKHGGSLRFKTQQTPEHSGTTFRVFLPSSNDGEVSAEVHAVAIPRNLI